MRFPRIRFSLRTLLLAAFCAGAMMMLWNVREPWSMRTWPLIKSSKVGYPYGVGPVFSSFSPSGRFLSVQANFYGMCDSNQGCVVDLSDGRIVRTFSDDDELRWNAKLDDLLWVSDKTHVRVIEFPGMKNAAEFTAKGDSYLSFTATGQYLAEHGSDYSRVIFRDVQEWKVISAFPALDSQRKQEHEFGHIAVSDDDRLVVTSERTRDEVFFNEAVGLRPLHVKCFDLYTGALKWTWSAPVNVWMIRADFDVSGAAIQVTCNLVDFKTTQEEDSAKKHFDSIVLLDVHSGIVLSERTVGRPQSIPIWLGDHGGYEAFRFYSADHLWKCETDTGHIVVTDTKTGSVVCRLSTGGAEICYYGGKITKDKWRILACLKDNRLAVWTRTRQHFEWWGLYERFELWLAVAFLVPLLWSLRRDWLTKLGLRSAG